MALHAVSLLTQRRLIDDSDRRRGEATLIVLPPPCPLAIQPIDFNHADILIHRGYTDACGLLDGGGADCPTIRMHMHRHDPSALNARTPRAATSSMTDQQQRNSVSFPSDAVLSWRIERLSAAGLPAELALSIAANSAYDLHALLSLVDRGCPAELAARILAPLDASERP